MNKRLKSTRAWSKKMIKATFRRSTIGMSSLLVFVNRAQLILQNAKWEIGFCRFCQTFFLILFAYSRCTCHVVTLNNIPTLKLLRRNSLWSLPETRVSFPRRCSAAYHSHHLLCVRLHSHPPHRVYRSQNILKPSDAYDIIEIQFIKLIRCRIEAFCFDRNPPNSHF